MLKFKAPKKQCSTCIFRNDGNQVKLEPGRLDEIRAYLLDGNTHLCHAPDLKGLESKTACRGGRDFQLQIWHGLGIIKEPTDEALEAAMEEVGL